MNARLDLNLNAFRTYMRRNHIPIEQVTKHFPKITKDILDSDSSNENLSLTFNQLVKLAKIVQVPTGLLVLNSPLPPEKLKINFRTLNSHQLFEMSTELKDTVLEMQEKQEFLRTVVENELKFVDSVKVNDHTSEKLIISEIREMLGTELVHNRFERYRRLLGERGVFIFLNGKYKDNTHRPLDLSEFRGFVLSDRKAPIIFINQQDSKTGRLFTMIHELVHLFFGDSDLLEGDGSNHHSRLEAKVNRITAEILVPESFILQEYNDRESVTSNLENIARKTEVSRLVVLRRLYDLAIIQKKTFEDLKEEFEYNFQEIPSKTVQSGGNYHTNLSFRIDRNFFNYVNNAVKQNLLSYTEAFNLVGVGYKGYKYLSEKGG